MTDNKVKFPNYVENPSEFEPAIRDSLPVSLNTDGRVISYFGDLVWDFYPYFYTKNKSKAQMAINFSNISFEDGTSLTDPEHIKLLNSIKEFIYARLAHKSPKSHKAVGHNTIIHQLYSVIPLIIWMKSNGCQGFNDLNREVCRKYIEFTKQELSKRTGEPLGGKTKFKRLQVLEHLYFYREHMECSLQEHPWPTESACSLSGWHSQGNNKSGKTEMIPDRISKKLMQEALKFVENGYGDKLLKGFEDFKAGKAIGSILKRLHLKRYMELNNLVCGYLYTACYIVIAMFSGLRDSEMASLKNNCFTSEEGWDGAQYHWIKGIAYKLHEDPKDVQWMVPPVVGKAVKLASRLSARFQSELETTISALETKIESANYLNDKQKDADIKTLHEAKKHCGSLFLGKTRHGEIRTWSTVNAGDRLKTFSRKMDLRVEPEDLKQVQNTQKIKVGDTWPLAPHQFRKTFGVYVARNILGDVRYLREHFKHWSLDMTLYYAAAGLEMIDETLFDEVITQRDELQCIIIGGWLDLDSPLSGNGSIKVTEWRSREDVRTAKNHQDLARKLSQGFYLRGTGHSWCTSNNCKGTGLYNVLACKDCENRLVDITHLSVWQGIRRQQIELLEMDDLGDPMWQRAKDHLQYAEQVLSDLESPVEPYSIPPKPSEQALI